MKILVLGGNSYIAKHFIKAYQERYELKIIRRDGVFQDYFDLKKSDFTGCDAVVNFTAVVHQKNASEAIHHTYNEELVKYIADLACDAGVKHFVQLSTISVYGENEMIDHTTVPNPASLYGKYKLKADEYLLAQNKRMVVSILRPTVVYGKGSPGNMATLVKILNTQLPLPLKYTNNQRAILCIDNLVGALGRIIDQKADGVFLIRDQEMPSIYEIAGQIKLLSSSRSILFSLPEWIYKRIRHGKFSVARKLFGDLKIDDSKTIQKLGEYRKESWKNCIGKML